MKTFKKVLIFGFIWVTLMAFAGSAQAASLSQSSITLTQGQTSTVTAFNVLTSLYVSSNSNSSVASVTISGTNINIYGNQAGTTNVVICENNTSSACNNLYITVNGTGTTSGLSLSQTSLSMTVGQTSTVTAYNTYGTYFGTIYISSNSNQGVATAYVTGNTISIYAVSYGSTTITVCQTTGISTCGTVYVSVAYGSTGGGFVYPGSNSGFNISAISLARGSSVTISSSDSGGLYASRNTNPSVASVTYTSAGSGYGGGTGCAPGALYNIFTGQPCNSYGGYNGYNTSYIPGCYAGALYSITTGQLCSNYNNYNNYGYNNTYYPYSGNNVSAIITALTAGTDSVTLCLNNSSSCTTIFVTSY